ncbi:MAG: HAMP domain-containing sensor histidine kinase [Pseudomonadota bacterium]
MVHATNTSVLAHDLRNLLSPALLALEALNQNKQISDSVSASRIQLAIDRAVGLCRSAMREQETTTAEIGEYTDIRHVLNDAATLALQSARGPVSKSVMLKGMNYAPFNPQTVHRMVYNLAHNAVKALGDRGGELRITGNAGLRSLRICVSDTGPGLPKSVLDRLFPSLVEERSCSGRIGLGIPSTAEAAHALGGALHLVSSGSSGVQFMIELPFADA